MGESAAYEIDHGEVDHGFGAVWVGFVVAGEAAVVHEPAEGPLDDPPSGNHLEAFDARLALDDFDVDAEGGSVVDDFGAVTGVGPGLGDAGVGLGDVGEQVDAAGVVRQAHGGDPDGQEETEGVDADMAFAAGDLLTCVDALA